MEKGKKVRLREDSAILDIPEACAKCGQSLDAYRTVPNISQMVESQFRQQLKFEKSINEKGSLKY